jgi:pimeloyl-ACP methyl ester carboxylesterase
VEQIEIGPVWVAFERAGEGPAVVLLHGVLGDSRMWRRQLDELCDGFTLVAWDAPGCGRSSDPPTGFRLSDYADCLAAFVDRLALARPHVVSVGCGGSLAWELYRRHPTLPRTLALSTAFPRWADALPADVVAQRLKWCRRQTENLSEPFARTWTSVMGMEAATARVADELVATMSDADPAGLRVLARSFAEASFASFPRVDVPTLLLYAVSYEPFGRKHPDLSRTWIPAGRIVHLPGIGHPASDTAPDRFQAEISDFLRAHM